MGFIRGRDGLAKHSPKLYGKKNYNIIEIASTESQSIESHGHETSKTKVRSGNWTEVMDSAMLNLMTEEHVLVLKRQFIMYQTLANKSGLGWDYDRNIPTAGDPSDWDAVVAENLAYSRCRDKTFPAYQDIAFLSGKTTATGRHGFRTGMHGEDVRNTSSSSPGTTAILQQIKNSMAGPSRFGQLPMAQQVLLPLSPANEEGPNDATSYSPTPTPMKSGNPNTSHASAHTSSGKRRRLSSPSHKTTPTSTRKGKLEYTSDAIQELVNLGKKRLNIAEQMLQRELDARPKVHSIEECMVRLYDISNLSLDAILCACEAFKDDRNKSIFMSLSDDILYMWIDRQLVIQRAAAGHKPDAPSFPPN
uniref:Myb/SANT-like domain-containing protein n=1 Tax=Ananas comosus var. bracteatus TaxID=296719 RepID=A0A6V7NJB9_ANACO|nr:unnamed protein product [Ananas comosus var. bracteatus]